VGLAHAADPGEREQPDVLLADQTGYLSDLSLAP
jgi:hypothetical protein